MHSFNSYPHIQLRRLRYHPTLRELVSETQLSKDDLIAPIFIRHGHGIKQPIASMPGHFQWSLDRVCEEIDQLNRLGITSIILFGIPAQKDPQGAIAFQADGIIQSAIPLIKKLAPQMLIIADLCFCEYTSHGHCGPLYHLHQQEIVNNEQTLALLATQALSLAQAGVDILAPSGMIDGMVGAIRHALDQADYSHLPILSYAVKYASALYGPFRDAAEGVPQSGDRRSHQMDYRNAHEALRESACDIAEGTDMLMVKPAHTYLDVIHRVKLTYPMLPLGAYHTSGEFAMIKAAAQANWLNEQQAVLEILTAIRRAGADFIISYYAKEVAYWLNEKT